MARRSSASARLQLVTTQLSDEDVLMCKDRSIGHDWPHDVVWEDGPDVKVGSGRGRTTIFFTYRYCRCIRCGTLRKETFIQDDRIGEIRKQKGNAYSYSQLWRDSERLEQAQIRHKLKKASTS